MAIPQKFLLDMAKKISEETIEKMTLIDNFNKSAKRGLQLQRKDKDLMTDTGGDSKKRKEPKIKPPRLDQKKPYSKNHKKPDELDKDVDKDKDLKLAKLELLRIAKLLR